MTVLIAAAQLNQTVGDFDGNARRIIEAAGKAAAQGARVLLTPELSLSGYPPEDLLLRAAFYDRCQQGLAQILAQCAGLDLHVVVGAPLLRDGVRRNAAWWSCASRRWFSTMRATRARNCRRSSVRKRGVYCSTSTTASCT